MKAPSWKTPLILAGFLVALSGFAVWLQYTHKPKADKEASNTKKPLALPSDDSQIASFKMRGIKTNLSAKCDSLAQKKCKPLSSGEWAVTEPIAVKADGENIKSFLTSLTGAIATETVDLSEDTPEKRAQLLTDYGLDEKSRNTFTTPMFELTLDSGKKLTVWFGAEHPTGDKYYVAAAEDGKLNDKTIFLISTYTRGNLDHDLTFFRNKSIFDFNRTDVTQFSAKVSSGTLTAVKDDKSNSWQINTFDANYEQIETLLSTIAQMKAREFPGSDAILKGAKSVLNYKLEFKKAPALTLELFEKNTPAKDKNDKTAEKHFYLKTSIRPDPVEVEPIVRTKLDRKVLDFRNTEILTGAQKASLEHVVIEGRNYPTRVEFAHENGNWIAKGPAAATVDVPKFTLLLDTIERAKITDFLSPAPPLDEVKMTLTFKNESHSWNFGMIKGKLYMRDMSNKRNEAYLLPDAVKSTLLFDSKSWNIKK